jgi:hypothetical protein
MIQNMSLLKKFNFILRKPEIKEISFDRFFIPSVCEHQEYRYKFNVSNKNELKMSYMLSEIKHRVYENLPIICINLDEEIK